MRKNHLGELTHRYTDGDIYILSLICPEGFWHDPVSPLKNKTQEERAEIINRWRESIEKYYKEHPEAKEELSRKLSGEGNPRYGKSASQEQRNKISQSKRGRKRMTNSQIFPKYRYIKFSEIDNFLNEGWCLYEDFNICRSSLE